jgi:hypothetical protein
MAYGILEYGLELCYIGGAEICQEKYPYGISAAWPVRPLERTHDDNSVNRKVVALLEQVGRFGPSRVCDGSATLIVADPFQAAFLIEIPLLASSALRGGEIKDWEQNHEIRIFLSRSSIFGRLCRLSS